MERRHALFAIRPNFAEALLGGRKRVEFRRVRPSLSPGDAVYVYATAPVKAVVGAFVCGSIVEGRPDSLWQEFAEAAGMPKRSFTSYFRGSEWGCAIEVRQARAWPSPLVLPRIRQHIPSFSPPQSYAFFTETEPLFSLLTRYSQNGAGVDH